MELRHVRFDSLTALESALARVSESGTYDDEEVDFLDGIVFSADESYLCLGRRTDEPGPVSDYSGVADKQAVQWMVADSEMELRAARLLTYQAAWQADLGRGDLKVASSIANPSRHRGYGGNGRRQGGQSASSGGRRAT